MIPYGRQYIDQNDINHVIGVLKSDFITCGPIIEKLEDKISKYCGSKYSIAVNSATSALHIACLALDLREGDIAWTSSNSFIASSNCILYCGAIVDFIDINKEDFNINTDILEEKLKKSKKNNKLPKIIILVHFAGKSCDMERIYKLSQEYGFKIIEDASHAIGGEYKSNKVGSCKYSDITIFSFHPVKIITTGEGGVITTNNKKIAKKLYLLRSHHVTRDKSLMSDELDRNNSNGDLLHGDWYYQQTGLGFNYRMSDINAALGVSQMDKLDKFIKRRRQIAQIYDNAFQNIDFIKIQKQSKNTLSSYHLYTICLSGKFKDKRLKVYNYLRENQIGIQVHYIPIHTQPFYQAMGFKWGDFPNTEEYYFNCLSLPLFYNLKDGEIKFIIKNLLELC